MKVHIVHFDGDGLIKLSLVYFHRISSMGVLKSAWAKLCRLHYLYEMHTAISVLQPEEQIAMHLVFFLLVSLVTFSAYVYLPHYIATIIATFIPSLMAPNQDLSNIINDEIIKNV